MNVFRDGHVILDPPVKVFTFWEGPKPAYIDLCMKTWKIPHITLTFDTLGGYTDLPVTNNLKRFSLPMISDAVRAHVLRDQGGYWLDADTILLTDKLPVENIKGYPETKDHTWGYLHAQEPNMDFFTKWAAYQDKVIADPSSSMSWPTLCRDFTDPYIKGGGDVTISPIMTSWPETYAVTGNIARRQKYAKLYFDYSWHLSDLMPTDMIMLHNSWTPDWYKQKSADEVLAGSCTLSNILLEVLKS